MKPLNKTAAIIGIGQIGGSLGLILKKATFFFKIFGCDKNIQRLKLAEKFFDDCFDKIEEALHKSDVVILASPINDIVKLLKFGFENFPEKLYTDVGSTKVPMLNLAKNYHNIRYIGGHPLAGSEKHGELGWDVSLFKGKPYFWTSDINQTKMDQQLINDMIKTIGATPVSILAEDHDRAIALTSHLPLFVSLAIMASFSEKGKEFSPFLGSGFKSMTRLSGGSPEMGKDLLISNKENILLELDKFLKKLLELKEILKDKNDARLLQKMKRYQNLYWQQVEKL